jgi:hypothetical protein
MAESTVLVLKNFSGEPEITPSAYALQKAAIAAAKPILKVETDEEQAVAVAAMQLLKNLRSGMETTRKLVKAPVLDLGKRIDAKAADFLEEPEREEKRLAGLINHRQREIMEAQRKEQQRIEREQAEVLRLEAEAKRKREEAERANDDKLKAEAKKLEAAAFDKKMEAEVSGTEIVVSKPKGLIVKQRLNFEVTDAIALCHALPRFFHWNPETETLKLRRRDILEELNAAASKAEIKTPIGMRIFEDLRTHVR